MTIEQIKNQWVIPKEIYTASAGVGIAATSNVAMQFLTSCTPSLPSIARNFICFSTISSSIIGTVMAIYSMICLSRKMVTENNSLQKNVSTLGVGVILSSIAQSVGDIFWGIAPSFHWLNGHSIAFAIATNLAWQVAMIAGISGIVFTAYGAYLTGRAILTHHAQ